MSKNIFLIIIAILVIGVGGYFLLSQDTREATSPAGEQANPLIEKDAGDLKEAEGGGAADDTDNDGDSLTEDEKMLATDKMNGVEETEEDNATEGDKAVQSEVKEFTVTGKNFEFSQKEIRVKRGDTVRINFSSTDGFYDWVVDEFNARTKRVQTSDSTFVEFVADQAGMFEYYCSVGQHRQLGMVGRLVIE